MDNSKKYFERLNIKKMYFFMIVCTVIFWAYSGMSATTAFIDPNVKVYFNGEISHEDAVALSINGDHKMRVAAKEITLQPGKVLDLIRIGGNFVYPEKNPAIISGKLLASEDGVCSLSIGADWWYEVYVNGKKVFATTEGGNILYAAEDNYSFEAEVKAGVNHFAVYLLSGSAAWLLGGPVITPEAKELDFSYRPYLTHADTGEVLVHFFATLPSVAYVDYREAGTAEWQRAFELHEGILRNDLCNHRILLKNLKEDTVYEYRAVLSLHPEKGEEIFGDIRTFKSFTSKTKAFTMFFISDTQQGIQNRKNQIRDYMALGGKNADFFVHGGDIDNIIDKGEELFLETYTEIAGADGNNDVPLILLRGNHEYRGEKNYAYFDFFGSKENKSYYGFRQGNTCFIVLDAGEDKPRVPDEKEHVRTYDRPLMHEQRRWLEEYVKSEEFLSARFHVVLCHTPGIGEKYMNESISIITDGIFTGSDPKYKLHLWIAAHTHFYIRSMTSNSSSVRVFDTEMMFPEFKTRFAYVVNDGPGSGKGVNSSGLELKFTSDSIEVKAMEQSGNVFDHFFVLPDGSVKEEFSSLDVVNF